jgi:Pyruvate/2-oxoacid:ferredoxin oxidoreductase delta subunit
MLDGDWSSDVCSSDLKVARMGLAVVNLETCLPYAGREACRMCVDECATAGYDAIEFVRVRVETDADGAPVEDSGFAAPVVIADKCVGCGLCQTRCYQINKKSKGLLRESAIIIEAGAGKEDRLLRGSYMELRKLEAARREKELKSASPSGQDNYLPDFLK